jgi:hypothetical protein
MDHFAGLDVSIKETSICIVDDTGGRKVPGQAWSELRRLQDRSGAACRARRAHAVAVTQCQISDKAPRLSAVSILAAVRFLTGPARGHYPVTPARHRSSGRTGSSRMSHQYL